MRADLARKFQRAIQLQQMGQLDAAATACQQVVDAADNEAEPLHMLGLIRKQQGRAEEAEKLLRSSMKCAPHNPHIHGNLGNLLATQNRFAEAEGCYRQALSLDVGFRGARIGLARMLNDAGEYAAAEQEARQLISARPDDAEAYSTLGAALAGQPQRGRRPHCKS